VVEASLEPEISVDQANHQALHRALAVNPGMETKRVPVLVLAVWEPANQHLAAQAQVTLKGTQLLLVTTFGDHCLLKSTID